MKVFKSFSRFLKTYFALKQQIDTEKVLDILGKPKTLELTQEQAEIINNLFCGHSVEDKHGVMIMKPVEPKDLAKMFFSQWPRTDFRYFMALSEDGKSLEFTSSDLAIDGVELIQAAMVKLGAIKKHEDDGEWYFQTAHPMVRRMAELGANQGDIENMTAKKRLFA